ncbi:protein lethal(2)essential for life-like [Topomyia yanbarensis]|uniref:protein lethal(2)essential for life-like n=1 Tax=Topomyia yanbarensis TaxID=2498891 RepID=UPI00273C16F8|nr:protein lethal(2)essential for life-like [Topomyia yanbarensis]
MSLIPVLFREWLDNVVDVPARPSRILEKYFGEDIFPSDLLLAIDHVPKRRGLKRPRHSAFESEDDQAVVKRNKDGFQVNIDVHQFKPEEISVKMANDYITVEGKHEEKQDEHGFVSRHFTRRYRLPDGHDADKVVSTLSSDGVLTIKAPKLALPESERTIPVERVKKLIKENGMAPEDENEMS